MGFCLQMNQLQVKKNLYLSGSKIFQLRLAYFRICILFLNQFIPSRNSMNRLGKDYCDKTKITDLAKKGGVKPSIHISIDLVTTKNCASQKPKYFFNFQN
jgi:hypothetical protein